jgi:glycosyltransferase involved in cell wall biosynthesis
MLAKIAYIVSRFPHLPETFILREMEELERYGWEVALYPLILQKQPIVHPEARPWVARARTVSLFSTGAIRENGRRLWNQPGRMAALLSRVAAENLRSPNFLVRAVYLFPKAVTIARMMQQEGIDHIHAHYATHPALVAWLVSHLTGIRYSMTVHAHDIFVRKAMLSTKLKDASFVVAISNFNRQYLADLCGPWVLDKTHVVHCGIRPEEYQPRESVKKDNKSFEIVHVGSLQPYKGQKFLIEACAILRDAGVPFRCRIIGGGDGLPNLKQSIRKYQLGACVELCGPLTQQEVANQLNSADCYVQPSIITAEGKMEGIPVALMEAMASGIPCIATQISGIPELIREGETGWMVHPEDASALAEKLIAVYSNPAEANRVALAGRQLVLEQFELSTNVKQLVELFDSTIKSELPSRLKM